MAYHHYLGLKTEVQGRQSEGKGRKGLESHEHKLKHHGLNGLKAMLILAASDVGDKSVLQKLGPFFMEMRHMLASGAALNRGG